MGVSRAGFCHVTELDTFPLIARARGLLPLATRRWDSEGQSGRVRE
jgi:hypothetical protein